MPSRIVTPPQITETSRNGIVLVDAVNDAGIVMNAVPMRFTGDVRGLVLGYAQLDVPGFFHRYACAVLVGSFVDGPSSEAAVPEAERYMRTHPAPGVKFASPLVQRREAAFVFAFTVIPLGHIYTHWDEVSGSIINETQPDHQMTAGFVVRQIARVGRNLFVLTYGEGDNTDPGRAYINGTFGTDGFWAMDQRIFRDMRLQPGFLASQLPDHLGRNPLMRKVNEISGPPSARRSGGGNDPRRSNCVCRVPPSSGTDTGGGVRPPAGGRNDG